MPDQDLQQFQVRDPVDGTVGRDAHDAVQEGAQDQLPDPLVDHQS